MKFLNPIRWNEGLFMRPHHLQHHDLFLEAREATRFAALDNQNWGLTKLQFDEESLQNFVLSVRELQAILPDGTLVDAPGNALVPNRSLEEAMSDVGQQLTVFIGLRRPEEQVPQTSSGGGDAQTRFIAAQREVYDLDAGRDPAPIEVLQYNLRLFLGDEPANGFEVMPIASLERTGDRTRPVKVNLDFAPPTLVLAASEALWESARAVVERVVLTVRELREKLAGADPEPKILYQALSGYLPVLKDMVQDGQVHPRRVYHEIARLCGALYYREKSGQISDEIPHYDHRRPMAVFEWLRQRVFELTEVKLREPFRRVPMSRSEDLYQVALPDEAKAAGVRFFLEVHADDSQPRLRVMLMGAKISNPDRLATLRDFALPGVPTELLPGPPPELPPGQTATFFRMKTEHEEWGTHVVPAGSLTVFILNAPEDVQLNLIMVLPE
ncbi:hypothetical protein ABI59_02680 [Acidobacteria bacterium Mor1]|nr:hypothetical protein ABI59_02680 [Acidobacteria bacterium Mor1]